MTTRGLVIKLLGIGSAVVFALLMPVSIQTGDAGTSSIVPVEVTDLCAVRGTCGPSDNQACLQDDGTWLPNAFCASGCGGSGPPPWGRP